MIDIKRRPRICLIDCVEEVQHVLEDQGFSCTAGTLGSAVIVPNKRYGNTVECLLNHSWPKNLHEYDVVIVDLLNQTDRAYNPGEHQREGARQVIFLSSYPETLFDPRPAAANLLGASLKSMNFRREFVLIVFAGAGKSVEYEIVEKSARGYGSERVERWGMHSVIPEVPGSFNMYGVDVDLTGSPGNLSAVLNRYIDQYSYHALFKFPTRWDSLTDQAVARERFFPLLVAHDDLIASYFQMFEHGMVLVLPACEDQGRLLVDILEEVLPEKFPAMFPENAQFKWLSDPLYNVPGEAALLGKRAKIESEYKAAITEVESNLKSNREKYLFLHQMLTETGDDLVKSVARYVKWLGFAGVRILDHEVAAGGVKEEDIQVDYPDGLLVIEVKGLAGTSTDSDCSQVSKIKYRRARERQRFDVFALYIVNHERFKPPEARRNPPFSREQITDADNDERGLLTTYQLFQLYFDIEEGLVTKEDAREALKRFGLVEFDPSASELLGVPAELHYGDKVAILELKGISLRIGDALVLRSGGRLLKVIVVGLQVQSKDVEIAAEGEVGVKVDQKIPKGAQVWKLRAA